MYNKIIPVFFLFVSSVSIAAEKVDFVNFFDQYQTLTSEFDASVNTMYADDAKVMGVRKKPDGTEESMTIDGAQWKTIILASMEQAKRIGDLNEYSDINIEVDGNRAKIAAKRFLVASCFTDDRFYMVVESTDNDQLQIVEQFMETPIKSQCEGAEPELPTFLQNTVKMINEQLPAAIDAETQLIKTSAEGTKLTYHYVLINYTSENLSTNEATTKLEGNVLKQSCSSPNLRPILDQDGSLSFIYRGSDAKQIVKFDVDKTACQG